MNETNNMLNSILVSTGNESHIVIGSDRTITVPDELKRIAVQYDHNIETVTFDCPRYWDGHDMSTMTIYINYLCPNMSTGSYWAQNVTIDPDDESIMHFDWTISRNVTEKEGKLKFLVCVAKTDVNGNVSQHWHSELNTDMYITDGLEVEHEDIEEYPDLITQILAKLQVVEKRSTKIETLASTDLSGVYTGLIAKAEVGAAVLGDDLGLMVGDLLLVTDTGCLWEVIFDVSSGAEGGTDDTYKCIAVLGGIPEGTMVLKGEVESLPETAKEGEVYTLVTAKNVLEEAASNNSINFSEVKWSYSPNTIDLAKGSVILTEGAIDLINPVLNALTLPSDVPIPMKIVYGNDKYELMFGVVFAYEDYDVDRGYSYIVIKADKVESSNNAPSHKVLYDEPMTIYTSTVVYDKENYIHRNGEFVKYNEVLGGGVPEGTMVFKGEVESLPETANEGEVYCRSQMEFEKVGDFRLLFDPDTDQRLVLSSNYINIADSNMISVLFEKIGDIYADSDNKPTIKFVANGTEYVYKNCYKEAEDYSYYYDTICGRCDTIDETINFYGGDSVEVYINTLGSTNKSYVYHNGEWIEL